ncbi:hypothetical protein FRC10_005049 [Ceratobasidium sp. 414]|nr:hypothetical protein FRC10_005049 [Ceratobasidium sp. 414]
MLLVPALPPSFAMRPSLASVSTIASLALLASAVPSPKYVGTDGTRFELDGKPYYFAGTNCYWCSFTANMSDVEIAFDAAAKAGLNVIRTWGFNEMNVTKIPGGLPQYGGEGAGPTVIYYQSWVNGTATINYGENGLGHFDKVVSLAEKKGIKLVVTLTNNWADYGGMDVYSVNLGGRYHDSSHSSTPSRRSRLLSKTTFKPSCPGTAKAQLSSRGRQLGNEPRCGADGVRNLPRGPNCTTTTLNNWMDEMSRFIKKIDGFHMISSGEEGFFNFPGDPDWAYNGGDGIDFYANTKLPAISYGTFHTYPDWWSKTPQWCDCLNTDCLARINVPKFRVLNFTAQHGIAQKKIGKPVVYEEYGWLTPEARLEYLGTTSNYSRLDAIVPWQKAAIEYDLAGDQFWQLGVSNLSFGRSTNDGFTIYLDDPEAKTLVYDHVKAVTKRNQ